MKNVVYVVFGLVFLTNVAIGQAMKPLPESLELFTDPQMPTWPLVLMLEAQALDEAARVLREKPWLASYQEPVYGSTLLIRAIGQNNYAAAKLLLEHGANPNLRQTNGHSAIMQAVLPPFYGGGPPVDDNYTRGDARFVKLLLEYGANPNVSSNGMYRSKSALSTEWRTTPLMAASSLDQVRALVDGGANINWRNNRWDTAASTYLPVVLGNYPRRAKLMEQLRMAHYLIVTQKADVRPPRFSGAKGPSYQGGEKWEEPFYAVYSLMYLYFPIDSPEYKIKMEIVEEFMNQGIDYHQIKKEQISERMINKIREMYPDTWEEYLEKY